MRLPSWFTMDPGMNQPGPLPSNDQVQFRWKQTEPTVTVRNTAASPELFVLWEPREK